MKVSTGSRKTMDMVRTMAKKAAKEEKKAARRPTTVKTMEKRKRYSVERPSPVMTL